MYEMFELDIGIAFGAEKNNNEMLIYINSRNVGLRPTFSRPLGVHPPGCHQKNNKWTHRWTKGHIDRQKDIQMDRRTYGWTEGHRWTEGHMDGQKDKIIKNSFLIIKNFL